jgi:purine nucleosidase
MTVADWWGVTERDANALFLGNIDATGYFNLITQRVARL